LLVEGAVDCPCETIVWQLSFYCGVLCCHHQPSKV
jgi:hypothetical protein